MKISEMVTDSAQTTAAASDGADAEQSRQIKWRTELQTCSHNQSSRGGEDGGGSDQPVCVCEFISGELLHEDTS